MIDAKITQDLKILQQLISKPPDGGAVVNVINIGRIQIGPAQELLGSPKEESSKKELENDEVKEPMGNKPAYLPHPSRLEYQGAFEMDEKYYDNLQYVMENLPEPRYDSLVRMMFEVSKRKFDKAIDAAEWVGMKIDVFYGHMRKYGLSKFKGRTNTHSRT